MTAGLTEERPERRSSRWAGIHPAIPYVVPFVAFFVLLSLGDYLQSVLGPWEAPFRVGVLSAILWVFSREVIDFRVRRWAMTVAIGIAVFAIWVAPDLLFPGYRQHWLFQNAITGSLSSSIPAELRENLLVLIFRSVRAVVLVPIIEELFWRAWLLRWLINTDFEKVALGAYTASSMWISALLFASEHGPYWEVGLIAGLAYNFLMIRSRSLGDCILAHAITNGVLSLFVVLTGRWEYWM
jgi:CAAX prenyl protease-like protein